MNIDPLHGIVSPDFQKALTIMFIKGTTTPKQRFKFAVVVILALTIAFLSANYYQYKKQIKKLPADISATVLNPPVPIKKLNLIDQTQQPFRTTDLKQHWNLVIFANPNKTTLPILNKAVQVFNEFIVDNELQKQLRLILIAEDPQVNTDDMFFFLPKKMPSFIGLTGKSQNLAETKRDFGYLEKTLNRSITLYIVNPKGELTALFDSEIDAVEIAKNLKAIMQFDP